MKKGIIYVYFNRAKYEKEGIEKYYVGQTIRTMEQRAGKDGRGYDWDDSNCNNKFARSIRKWGWDAFEGRVLEEVYEEDLNELEKFYIEYFDSFKNGYNSTLGGEGTRGYSFNKESKKRLSISSKKRWKNPKEKEKQSIVQRKRFKNKNEREKLSKAQNKRFENKEEREKISIAVKKRFKDKNEREKQSITIKTSLENPEIREKMSKVQKERLKDPKEREKCGLPGEKSPNVKSVYCNELNIIFSYIGLAREYCKNVLNIKIGQISLVCDYKLKSSGRYNGTKLTWSWTENLDKETLNNAIYIDSKKYEEIINAKINN